MTTLQLVGGEALDTGWVTESQRRRNATRARPIGEAALALTDRFGLLASSIAGRTVAVASTSAAAWTDGQTVYVRAEDAPREVIIQAAHLRANSFDPVVVRALTGRPTLSKRYLTVEGRRALAGLADVLLAGAFAAMHGPVGGPMHARTDSPAASLRLARSRAAIEDPPVWYGLIRARKIRRSTGPGSEPHTGAAGRPESTELGALTTDPRADPNHDGRNADDGAGVSRILKALRSPAGLGALSRLLRKHLGSTFGAEQGASGAGRAADRIFAGADRGAGVLGDAPAEWEVPSPLPHRPWVLHYPEWDSGRRTYRPDWCSVVEATPAARSSGALPRHPRHDWLRHALAPLGLGVSRVRRQRGGIDLDLDAAIDARVLAVSGHSPTDTVYVDNLRRRRELGVVVLLDASGSANEADPVGTVLFARQREAAAALLDTLTILGDRVAGYSFQSMGRHNVVVTRLKGFDERFGDRQQPARRDRARRGYTRLGAAVRHATRVLGEDSGMRHRVLIVISDGFPYDIGYERSLRDAERSGRASPRGRRTRALGGSG